MGIGGSDKYQVVIDAKNTASKEVNRLTAELNRLGGPELVKAQKQINKLNREIKLLGGTSQTSHGIFSRFTLGVAKGNIIANAATGAWRMFVGQIKHAIEVGLESEKTYRDVASSLARHNTNVAIGIANITAFTARLQNLTAISDEVVAVAFTRLNDQVGNANMAMKLTGVTLDFATAKGMDYASAADLVGKAVISETNALSRYGITIDTTASKADKAIQIQEELNRMFGGAASDRMDSLSGKIDLLSNSWDDLLETLTASGSGIGTFFNAFLIGVIKVVQSIGDILSGGVDTWKSWYNGVATVITSAGGIIQSMVDFMANIDWWALLNPFDGDSGITSAWATFTTSIAANWMQSLSAIDNAISMSKAQLQLYADTAVAAGSAFWLEWMKQQQAAQDQAAAVGDNVLPEIRIPQAVFDDFAELQDDITVMGNTSVAVTNRMKLEWIGVGRSLQNAMNGAANRIIGSLGFLQTESTGVWKNMAADFMKYFIDEILSAVSKILIPKMLGFLGSLFDTPANDRMAARQGFDFASYFQGGVMRGLKNMGGSIAAAAGGSAMSMTSYANAPVPMLISSDQPAASNNIYMYFQGPVTSEEFVLDTIIPAIEAAAFGGSTSLLIKRSNMTGGADVVY